MKEKELIKLLQAGSSDEAEIIVKENYAFVYSFLYRRCFQADLAKELTQETFYRFFRNIHSYEAKGKLLNYLYRVALHLLYDETRKNKHVIDEYDMEIIEDDAPQASDILHKKQRAMEVQRLLKMLPPSQQDVLVLRFYQDLKFKDIASITGSNVSTVKSRYQAALKVMEQKWKEGEQYEEGTIIS